MFWLDAERQRAAVEVNSEVALVFGSKVQSGVRPTVRESSNAYEPRFGLNWYGCVEEGNLDLNHTAVPIKGGCCLVVEARLRILVYAVKHVAAARHNFNSLWWFGGRSLYILAHFSEKVKS